MAASTINTECKRYGCMKNLLACYANCRYTMRCDELRNELVDKTAAAEGDINRYLHERGRAPIVVQILKRGVKFDDQAARPLRKSLERAAPSVIEVKPRLKPAVKARSTTIGKASPAVAERHHQAEPGIVKAVSSARPAAGVKLAAATKRPAVRRPRRRVRQQKATPPASALPTIAETTSSRRAASLRVAKAAPRKPGENRSRKKSKMPRRARPETAVKAVASDSSAAPSQAITDKPAAIARVSGERAAPRKKIAAKSRKPAKNGKVYIIIEGQTASIVDEQGLMLHLFSDKARQARYFEASEVEARLQIVLKR